MKRSDRAGSPMELEKFDRYLSEMDSVLDAFVHEAALAGFVLDYSLGSTGELERLIERALSVGADEEILRNRSARYLGEVFRKVVGGHWELCLKGSRYLYHGLPVITGYSLKPIEFSPVSLVGNFVIQRRPGLLRAAIEADRAWAIRH